MSAITQYDVVFIPRLFYGQDFPFKGNISEENPETKNNSVLKLKEKTNRMSNKLAGRRRIYQKRYADFKSFIVQINVKFKLGFNFFLLNFPMPKDNVIP